MGETPRIFVGCDPNDCDLEQMMVLEYSLRKHASLPLDIHWMQLSRDPQSFWYADPERRQGWRSDDWTTPFSGFRWSIPALCGFQGRAIYMDADMLVLCDIAELWQTPFEAGKVVMAKGGDQAWRFCVSMWDCAAARAHLPPLPAIVGERRAHHRLLAYFRTHSELIQAFDGQFNNIDGEGLPIEAIKILHYSDIGTQLSHKHSFQRLAAQGERHWFDGAVFDHPRQDLVELFDRHLAEALAAGYSLDRYRVKQRFGTLCKASRRNYKGNPVTRGKQPPGLLRRLFGR